jgi:hypothetical protein
MSGYLRSYELAFLKAGNVLVRDSGNRVVMMWLCRTIPERGVGQ